MLVCKSDGQCGVWCFVFEAEDGIRDLVRSRGLGDVYKRQVENIAVWKDTHEGDTSRSKKRIPGLSRLEIDAKAELKELTEIRDKSREYMGQDQKPVERTENKLKTEMEGNLSLIHISEPTRQY